MDEPVRWVTKAEAAEELDISFSTLDRKIRSGEVEVVREGRRVYVRMQGPEYLSDEELLRRSAASGSLSGPCESWTERSCTSIRVGAGAGRGQGVRIRQQTAVLGA